MHDIVIALFVGHWTFEFLVKLFKKEDMQQFIEK
jgi:hypothetical protein